MRRTLPIVVAMACGSAPALAAPVAFGASFDPKTADTLSLLASVTLLLYALFGATVEANTVMTAGPNTDGVIDRSRLRELDRDALRAATPFAVPLALAVPALYTALSDGQNGMLLLYAIPLVAYGPIATLTAVRTGLLIRRGRLVGVYLAQGLRYGPPVTLALLTHSAVLTAVSLVFGELLRLAAITALSRRILAPVMLPESPTRARLLTQFASMGTSQVGPVADRGMLTYLGSAGTVNAYDLSEKGVFAGQQLVSAALIAPRLGRLASDINERRLDLATARRALQPIAASAAGISVVSCLALWGAIAALGSTLPPSVATGLTWSLISVWGLPMVCLYTFTARALIGYGRQRQLFGVAVTDALLNISGNIVFGFAFGPIGIVWSTLLSRLVGAVALLVLLRRCIVGHDSSQQRSDPRQKAHNAPT